MTYNDNWIQNNTKNIETNDKTQKEQQRIERSIKGLTREPIKRTQMTFKDENRSRDRAEAHSPRRQALATIPPKYSNSQLFLDVPIIPTSSRASPRFMSTVDEENISSHPKVGNLIISEVYNYFTITNVACDRKDIKVGLRKNGHQIELRRSQNNGDKVDVKYYRLPYQIEDISCCSVTYYPMLSDGLLRIIIPKHRLEVNQPNDLEICRFRLVADPSVSNTQVFYEVIPKIDHYIFCPGLAHGLYDVNIVVTIAGDILRVFSEYSYKEGSTIKTVQKQQAVKLPVTPTFDQIEVRDGTDGAKIILIFPYTHLPKSPISVPDINFTIGSGLDQF